MEISNQYCCCTIRGRELHNKFRKLARNIGRRLEDISRVQMVWLELPRQLYARHEFEWFEPDNMKLNVI